MTTRSAKSHKLSREQPTFLKGCKMMTRNPETGRKIQIGKQKHLKLCKEDKIRHDKCPQHVIDKFMPFYKKKKITPSQTSFDRGVDFVATIISYCLSK